MKQLKSFRQYLNSNRQSLFFGIPIIPQKHQQLKNVSLHYRILPINEVNQNSNLFLALKNVSALQIRNMKSLVNIFVS